MTPREFVHCLHQEKEAQLGSYLDPTAMTSVGQQLIELDCTPEQKAVISNLIDTVLTDTYYTILLGLDGCARLGDIQQNYIVQDEQGNVLCSGNGEVEGLAYEYFHSGT